MSLMLPVKLKQKNHDISLDYGILALIINMLCICLLNLFQIKFFAGSVIVGSPSKKLSQQKSEVVIPGAKVKLINYKA